MDEARLQLDDLVVEADPVVGAGRDAVESGQERRQTGRELGRVDPERLELPEDLDEPGLVEPPGVVGFEVGSELQKLVAFLWPIRC